MTDIAIEIKNICTNYDNIHLGTGRKDAQSKAYETYKYPQGQVFRGVFGYFFLEMSSKLSESWKNQHTIIYFKDSIPLHYKDDGILLPTIVEGRYINYECQTCHKIERNPTYIEIVNKNKIQRNTGTVGQIFRLECITRPVKYNFRLIYNLKVDKDNLGDLLGLLKFIKENGMTIGKGGMKGFGKLTFLKEFTYHKVTLEEIKSRAKELASKTKLNVHLLSDFIISDNGIRDIIDTNTLLKSIKNAGKFFNPEYQSYQDPDIKLISYETLPPHQISFLDTSDYIQTNGISAGTKFTYEVKNGCDDFYISLAIAERCRGIGSRTSFGKGEFIIK